MRSLLYRLLIPCWLVLLPAAGAAGEEGPHAFMDEPGRCGECHLDLPVESTSDHPLRFQKDIVSLCLSCHGETDLITVHPVDIRPAVEVPADLPLDEHGTMTCATCHDPHGPARGERPFVAESLPRRLLSLVTFRSTFPTYFLRRRNDQGQLCLACHQRSLLATEGFHVEEMSLLPEYAGSGRCGQCHAAVYEEWKRTPHARMVADVRRNPGAIAADFGEDPPFPQEEVAYRLGVHWTQRYVVEKEETAYVKAAIWSLVDGRWDRSYWIDKPWTPYCQGCHTTGFEVRPEPGYVELGIGCEACHGPGRRHAESGGKDPVVNPRDLGAVRRDMICQSCHTVGHDRTGQYRFPLGYLPGKDLTRYYKGLLPKPGQDNETFAGDESYEDRHRQWLFWVEHYMDPKGLACDLCKSFREREAAAAEEKAVMTPSEHCLSCHEDSWPETVLHREHLERDVHCHRCHVPTLAPGGERYSIHDHKFLFLEPETPVQLSLRESCGQCHDGSEWSGDTAVRDGAGVPKSAPAPLRSEDKAQ